MNHWTMMPLGQYNLISAMEARTPRLQLWTNRGSTTNVSAMATISGSEAYFMDLVKNSLDDFTSFGTAGRRAYTAPMVPGAFAQTLKSGSFLEVAIALRPAGQTAAAFQYVPTHSGGATTFLTSRTFNRDGVVLPGADANWIATNRLVVDSSYTCKHTDFPQNLATLRVVHTLTKRGLHARTTFNTLEAIDVNPGYASMITTTMSSPRLAACGVSAEPVPFTLLPATPQEAPAGTTCIAFGKAANSTIIGADVGSNLLANLWNNRFTSGFKIFFAATTNKAYWVPVGGTQLIPAGESFTWEAEWSMAEWASLVGA
jgi:hypothetical protein